jgi:carboxypeptidase D
MTPTENRESYAGMYVPYIAYNMLQSKESHYFDVKGIQINDPVIGHDSVQTTS